MEKITKQFKYGPTSEGGYAYSLKIKEGTTFKDFMKYVIQDIPTHGTICVKVVDPELKDAQYLSNSEKLLEIKIDFVDTTIKSISHIHLYNEYQDVEIDTYFENILYTCFNLGEYTIKLKDTL